MKHFFFGEDSQRMFGVLTEPAGRARTGLVFCPPLGEEMVATYARFGRWSKELADLGITTLRYHARGTGESDAATFTVESAAQDVATAVRWMRENTNLDRVGVFGLRFGGTVAARSAARPDFMIFWSPIVNLRLYFRDLLRLRMTKDMVHLKQDRVRVTAKELTADLEAGRSIDLLGYETSPELYREMTASEVLPGEPPASEVLWMTLPSDQARAESAASEWKDRGCNVAVQAFRERVFWEDFSSDFPHQFAESSVAFMQQGAVAAVGAR
jgi:uncharacterized protein